MRLFAASVLCIQLLASQTANQQSSPTIPKLKDVNPQILRLVIQDQWDRGNDMFGKGQIKDPRTIQWAEVSKHDRERHAAVRKLLAEGALKSAQDYQFASLIFQHSAVPADLMLAHVLATIAVSKGASHAKWLTAATLDRYLQSIKQPQVFGTQFRRTPGKPWFMDPYNKAALSDSVRAAYCVVPLATQEEILKKANSGGRITSTTLPHCT